MLYVKVMGAKLYIVYSKICTIYSLSITIRTLKIVDDGEGAENMCLHLLPPFQHQ